MIKTSIKNLSLANIVFILATASCSLYGWREASSYESILATAKGERAVIAHIAQLLQNGGDINAGDDHGNTLLHKYAGIGKLHVVMFLIENDADINCQNQIGFTPLHNAAIMGNENIVRFLIDHGAEIDIQDEDGATPLCHSFFADKLHIASLLLSNGADFGAFERYLGGNPLHYYVEKGNLEAVKFLVENHWIQADVNARPNRYAGTPLTRAIVNKQLDIAEYLLEHGADHTELLLNACGNGALSIVKSLVEAGADIDPQTEDAASGLLYSLDNGYNDVAKYLIERYAIIGDLAGECIGDLETAINKLWPTLLSERRDKLAEILKNTELPTVLQQLVIALVIDI